MKILEAKLSDGWLCFKLEDIPDGYRFLNKFRPGNYDIVTHREKRSKTANAYAWELLGKIAAKVALPVLEVYRNAIEDVSAKTEVFWCESRAVNALQDAWCGDHLGRSFRIIDNDGQQATVLATYGSSDFNTSEMAALIDHIVQDCRALGIETRPQEDIDSLLEAWNEKQIRDPA